LNEDPYGFQLYGLCNGTQEISITDANGCPGTVTFNVPSSSLGYPNVGTITPSCATEANGTITVDYFGMGQAWFRVVGGSIDSVYVLPDVPYVITGLPAGIYDVMYWDIFTPPLYGQLVYCTGSTEAVVGEIPAPCGGVSGRVFHDAAQDCEFNNNDIPLPNRVLTIGPDEVYAITDGDGYYSLALPLGSYTLLQPLNDVEQLCPPDVPVPFTLTDLLPSAVIDLADSSTVPHDIEILLWSSAARPGFPTAVTLHVRNNSAYPSGSLSIDLQYDQLLTDPSPANAQWSVSSLAPYGHQSFQFQALVPADINLLGSILTYTATVTNTANEPDLTNNTAIISQTITGSYDPNDKLGTTNGSVSNSYYFLAEDEWIDYTIRFQNTGTDTAFTVVIRDTLDLLQDIPSLDILGSSHPFTASFEEGRTLAFTFNDILLPDSTTDLLGSQGFISYRIRPVPNIIVGDVIENTAGIYFDFNPPIITNTTSHVVEISTQVVDLELPAISVYPNPANETLVIRMPEGMTGISAEVFSTDGRLLSISSERSMNTFTIDIGALSKGAYFVKVQHADGTSTARFMKQ
jgi:hypothetical protein